jgi:hypothetical protein
MPNIFDVLREKNSAISRSVVKQSCAEWAMAYRIMGEPFAGNYTFKYHPWCREIHDCRSPLITAKKSAQAGFTEIAINMALYTLDIKKRDVLYVLPTKTPDAADFSTARFGAALALSPYIGSMFINTNKIELKQAGSANLYIRGSNSESGLKSIPVSVLILDEYDEMREKSIELAKERLSGQVFKTIFSLSTPTVPGRGIDALFQKSTREHFYFECPGCHKHIELRWPESVVIRGSSPNDPECHDSYIICYECKRKIEQAEKHILLGKGYWQSTVTGIGNDHRGFHINQLYSSTVTPGEIVKSYHAALQSEIAFTEFKNSKLGEAYIGADAKITDEEINRAIALSNNTLDSPRPTDPRKVITMGIDSGKFHYICICEWTFGAYGYDLNAEAKCKVLWTGKRLEGEFDQFDNLMREWQVHYCIIDPDPNINDARRFARRFPGFVGLCRYRQGCVGKEIQPSDQDSGAPIYIVDRTAWMDAALGRFHREGRITLPKDISMEMRDQFKSPARVWKYDTNKNPTAHYVETEGADHIAHALTYAEIALPLAASRATNRSISAFL